ncbi:Uncharacterised protein [Mycobacteroides abscessus subsp. massiliense]|nr:Uncharacterised protein [Mycobacteroides abscessus subsp. massiliense]
MLDTRHQSHQGADVVHVLQAGGPLPLLPQRRSASGCAAGQQQGACRAFAEPCGEQCRPADLPCHDRLDLRGVEDEKICPGWAVIGIGQAHHDAVVGGGG